MKSFHSLALLFLIALIGSGCSTPPPLPAPAPPSPADQEFAAAVKKINSDEWRSTAKQIKTPDYTIFYHGEAKGAYTADGKEWRGTITGAILGLKGSDTMSLPKGTLSIGPNGLMKTSGESRWNITGPQQNNLQ